MPEIAEKEAKESSDKLRHTSLPACGWGAVVSEVQLCSAGGRCSSTGMVQLLDVGWTERNEMVFFAPSRNTDQGV